MSDWKSGYSRSELDQAQDRYDVRFPSDLYALLLDRNPARGYAWDREDPTIRHMLAWPLDCLLFDVDHGSWWPAWGERPIDRMARHEVVRDAIRAAPKLIPILGHRFLPATPDEAGNPVFSMHGFDTIQYGANLAEYFSKEFCGTHHDGASRRIAFWSDLAEEPERVIVHDPDSDGID
ncbi:hypothetical protein ABS767_00535 [Sphingomonas sp. ST-64]|uniref:SMI1/KNR4 family protein n=1 Tax=Sphingomonas plantiphila TaxID=3163295 RepID=A0ABW8YJX7_9SPHN